MAGTAGNLRITVRKVLGQLAFGSIAVMRCDRMAARGYRRVRSPSARLSRCLRVSMLVAVLGL